MRTRPGEELIVRFDEFGYVVLCIKRPNDVIEQIIAIEPDGLEYLAKEARKWAQEQPYPLKDSTVGTDLTRLGSKTEAPLESMKMEQSKSEQGRKLES